MSGHPQFDLNTANGRRRSLAGMLGTAVFLVLIVGAAPATQGQSFSVLHNFNYVGGDGAFSVANLVRDPAGNLYGTTRNGGAFAQGTVFRIDASGNETLVHSFSGTDGAFPYAGLALDSAGNLYGTTAFGGASGFGTVFEIDTSGNETVLYSFHSSDGAYPFAGVVRDADGNLYGTTLDGGTWGYGTVFKIDTSGTETVLENFDGDAQGGNPFSGVILDTAGNLYGTTFGGGASNFGVVYKLDASANYTVIHSFGFADGANPYAGLALDAAGNLYGTSYSGGEYGFGVVFKLDTSGNETVIHSFDISDGGNLRAGVALDTAGNLYGTTFEGGASNAGTVFKIDPSGIETTLHSFDSSDGGNPYSGVALDSADTLYGTTFAGGSYGFGTVFEIVQEIPFSAFTANVEYTSGFELKGDFVLGPGGPAINPVTQGLTLGIGTYSVTIPVGAFQQANQGWFEYDGTINGMDLQMRLTQTGANAYEIQVHAQGVDMGSPSNPVTLKLTIGQNSGTTQVNVH